MLPEAGTEKMMRYDEALQHWITKALAPALACAAVALSGCGVARVSTPSIPVTVPGSALHGAIHGGQQPVSGATIQLYAANTTGGYGSNSAPLLTSTVLSDGNGAFNITGDYTCPAPGSLVYLVATGGNPGLGSTNANLALMAALGPCGNLTASTLINVNELTTIASVYPLAPFMKSLSAVGTSSGNLQGLSNAFATVNNLVNTGSGTLPGPTLPANAVLPGTELNTLADIIAACVNSGGGVANDGSVCGTLFLLTSSGGTAPTDTIGAALNIARSPGKNVTTLIGLSSAVAPFQPTLLAASDFTVSIKYKSAGLQSPSAAAVDAAGNLWVTNSGNNTISVLNPAGTPVTGSPFSGGGLSTPSGVAIDAAGNGWITNQGNSSLSVFTPSGAGTQTTANGLNMPSSLAIDAQGTIWVANSGNNSVTAVATSGVAVTGSTSYGAGGVNTPKAVAINPF
jgi:hypothetical protein